MTHAGGIHHVTAMCGPASENMDFYVRVLGQRLIKQTVNFEDPGAHHLYYGAGAGAPGTVMTFFPWPQSPRGTRGSGEVTAAAYHAPEGAVEAWRVRLQEAGVEVAEGHSHFGERLLAFRDWEDIRIELVFGPRTWSWTPPDAAALAPEFALGPFHSVTLEVADTGPTVKFLTGVLGWQTVARAGERVRLDTGAEPGRYVDVAPGKYSGRGRLGTGSIHHVAFRAADEVAQDEIKKRVLRAGIPVTPVQDRLYFRSIYFREPGGVLCEIATDGPGFAVDEEEAQLGDRLMLPPWLEDRRPAIEAGLPHLENPR